MTMLKWIIRHPRILALLSILIVLLFILASISFLTPPKPFEINNSVELADHVANAVLPIQESYGEVITVQYGKKLSIRGKLTSEQFSNLITKLKEKKMARKGDGEISISSSLMYHIHLYAKEGTIKLIVSELDFTGSFGINFEVPWRFGEGRRHYYFKLEE